MLPASRRKYSVLQQILVVMKIVATAGPVPVGEGARADADQHAPGGLDFLRHGHEVAVTAHDDESADMPLAAHVFHDIQAKPDVGAVFG